MNRENPTDAPPANYVPRAIDTYVGELLESAGAVLIEGPRGCGKTETALHNSASHIFLDSPLASRLRETYPERLLQGDRPRLLDEWQLAPEVWNLICREVDRQRLPGQFLLTGSSVPDDDTTRHTGAARFLRARLYTMTWFERGLSHSGLSLAGLFAAAVVEPNDDHISLDEGCARLCTSGYPGFLHYNSRGQWRALGGILEETTHSDMSRLADVRHSPHVVQELLRSLARTTASTATFKSMAEDIRVIAPSIKQETVARYVGLLERLFIVDRQPAWAPRVQSRARFRTTPKWHLADPVLAARALGLNATSLANNPELAGLIFESAVVHDLRVFAQNLDGKILHYRTAAGEELDAVIELPDGSWAAVEVKLSELQVPRAAEQLRKVCAPMVTPPAFRLIVTLTGPTYQLPDGTITCPLSALSP